MKTTTFRCSDPGCKEVAIYRYDNRKEYDRLHKDYGEGRWKCVRHNHPEENLSPTNRSTSVVLVSRRSLKFPESKNLYWSKGEQDGSGFTFGEGYKAYTDDFPEGTQLIVTAQIILPESQDA